MASETTSSTPTTATKTSTANDGGATTPPDVTALPGTRTVDDKVAIEGAILAYASLDSAAGTIATYVHGKAGGSPVVLHHEKDASAALAYRAFRAQVTNLTNALNGIAPPKPAAEALSTKSIVGAIGGVTLVVKAVVELLGLFRTNVDIKGVAITPDETALIAEVAGRLAHLGVKTYVPSIVPFPSDGANVQDLLTKLLAADHDAASRAGNDAAAKAAYDALHAVVAALTAELSKAAADGATLMATIVRGEGVTTFAEANKPLTLFVKILQMGGGNRLRQSLLPTKGIEYSGGAIVDYILFAHDGAVLGGATYEGYKGDVKDLSEIVPD